MRLVVSNSRSWTRLPGNKGSSSSSKTSSSSPSLTSSRSSPRSKTSPDVKQLVQRMAAQLLAIGQVRPNLVALEAQSVDELFGLVLRRAPVAMQLPFVESPPAAPRRRRFAAPTLFTLAQLGATAIFG